MISASSVSFAYGDRWVVDSASLDVPAGSVVGLVGPNGSGKTTLLRTLYGALRPSAGTVVVDDRLLSDLSAKERARSLGVVVQEGSVDFPLTVRDMVALGRTPHLRSFARMGADDTGVCLDALARVGADHLIDRAFAELSGGERQRVLIARALAQQADHLLLDEPTNHLDVRYQHETLALVGGVGATVLVVLHDLNLAARYCDSLVLLRDGAVVAAGPPGDVLVPEVIEPTYEIGVERHDTRHGPHLVFSLPHRSAARSVDEGMSA